MDSIIWKEIEERLYYLDGNLKSYHKEREKKAWELECLDNKIRQTQELINGFRKFKSILENEGNNGT